MPKQKRSKRAAAPASSGRSRSRDVAFSFAVAVAVAFVFLLGLAMRLWHVVSIEDEPFGHLLLGDAASYDRWAREIASGNWVGSDVFYQSPLYPYFLGVIYRLLGDDLPTVRLVQALIGALTCVFLALATRKIFSAREGLAAGIFLALYAPAIFADGWLQKSSLDLFLLSLLLWIFASVLSESPSHKLERLMALGMLLGFLTLNRENALVLAVAAIAWIAFGPKRGARWLSAGAFAVGLAAVLVPVGLRNAAVGGEFLLTTAQLGPNLYIGNHSGADGTYRSLRPRRGDALYERHDAESLAERALGRELTPKEVSSYYVSQVAAFIRTEPAAWGRLVVRKLLLFFNAVEIPDTEDMYSVSERSPPLRLTGAVFHFGTLFPLAIIGLAATWQRRETLWPLYLMMGLYTVSVVVFYVFARYRLPVVPFLVVFAAAGLVRLRASLRPAVGLAIAAALVVTFWPALEVDRLRSLTHYNWGRGLAERGEEEKALQEYRRALALDPDFALVHNNLGNLYFARDDREQALVHLSRAVALDPGFEEAHNNLANLLIEGGDLAGARAHLEAALAIRPDYADARNNLGNLLSAEGRRDEARRAYEEAIALDPDHARAHHNLGTLFLERLEHAKAEQHLRRSLDVDPESAETWNNLGIVHALLGDLEGASRAFRRALAIDPGYEEARANLARAERGPG